MTDSTVAGLRREVIDVLKQRFVGRDEVVDLIALAVVGGGFLFGISYLLRLSRQEEKEPDETHSHR